MITSLRAAVAPLAVLSLAAIACGDDSSTSGSGGAGGSTTSQGGGSTTSQGGGSTTSQGGGSTTSQGGGGGGDVCNPDAPTPIAIEVRNDTDVRLWLGWSNTDPRFVEVDGEGEAFCPCDQGMCPNGGVASVVEYYGYLEPGESITRPWSGLFYDVPASPECSCDIGRRPDPGTLTARAEGFLFECLPGEGVMCECPLATEGACSLAESGIPLLGQPSTTAEATFSFPDDTTVVVSFTEPPEAR